MVGGHASAMLASIAGSGDIVLNASRAIEKLMARSASGSIELSGGARNVRCDTSSGDIVDSVDTGASGSGSQVENQGGTVHLKIEVYGATTYTFTVYNGKDIVVGRPTDTISNVPARTVSVGKVMEQARRVLGEGGRVSARVAN